MSPTGNLGASHKHAWAELPAAGAAAHELAGEVRQAARVGPRRQPRLRLQQVLGRAAAQKFNDNLAAMKTGAEALARRIHPALQAAHAAIRQLRPNAASPAISASILATIGALTLQLAPPTPQPVQVPTPPPQPAYTTSAQGVAFITRLETLPGVSERLHWPGGTSGVTLGAGYDLSARSRTQVMRDMLAIGLATRTARAIAAGAGLAGTEAARFAARNQDLVVLSASQQRKPSTPARSP